MRRSSSPARQIIRAAGSIRATPTGCSSASVGTGSSSFAFGPISRRTRAFSNCTLNYLSYFAAVIFVAPLLQRPDVVVATSPQFFCGLAGLVVKAFKRAPLVLEIRDLWPESIVTVGAMRKGRVIRALESLEAYAYRRADRIVSVTNFFVDHIAQRGGDGKIEVIKNGVDFTLFNAKGDGASLRERYGLGDRIVAAYVGTHGMAHGLDTILDAAELLREDDRIVFLFVGDGAERPRLVARAKAMGLENVRLVGQLPKSEMPAVWSATDISLILLKKSDTFTKVLPSKMFEAMAMRRPIVLGLEGEAKQLLEDAGAGVAIAPENASELAEAVRRFASNPELRARCADSGLAYAREHYDRAKLAQRYIEMLQRVAASARC